MIAVIERRYSGLKTFDGRFLLPGARGLLKRLSNDDRILLEKMLSEPVVYVDNPLFHDPGCAADLAAAIEQPPRFLAPEVRLFAGDLFIKSDQRPTAAPAFRPLTGEQENELFVQMNYARFRIFRLLQARKNRMLTLNIARELLRWRKREVVLRNRIAQANVPLVLTMVRDNRPAGVELADLIAEGNLALLRSVDRFDPARGFKFSTYACRSILKSFARAAFQAGRYHKHFPLELESGFAKSTGLAQTRREIQSSCLDRLRSILTAPGDGQVLSPLEKQILRARYALERGDSDSSPSHMTLDEVGKMVGLSKERVRQIQTRALKKLRVVLDDYILSG